MIIMRIIMIIIIMICMARHMYTYMYSPPPTGPNNFDFRKTVAVRTITREPQEEGWAKTNTWLHFG